MRKEIITDLKDRLATEITSRNPVYILRKFDIEEMFDIFLSTTYMYTRTKRGPNKYSVFFSETASAIGHAVRSANKLPADSSSAVKIGAFLLYSLDKFEVVKLRLGQGSNKHAAYLLEVVDEDALNNLWLSITAKKVDKRPSNEPYPDWITTVDKSGMHMIKTKNKDVLSGISPETHPSLFENLNKSQRLGWIVKQELVKIQKWALAARLPAFDEIWKQVNPEARLSKLREANAILSMAEALGSSIFYHKYYYDFRGRKYPATAYLHEQGSEVAKAILRPAIYKPIGKNGYRWLLIALANHWAGSTEAGIKTDKLSLDERAQWSTDRLSLLISYGTAPRKHTGWMEADKPWLFLAACMELSAFKLYQAWNNNPDDYQFLTNYIHYVDGSNNGCQHLAALTLDEIVAEKVNLLHAERPNDLYAFIAEPVWKNIIEEKNTLPEKTVECATSYVNKLISMKSTIVAAGTGTDERKLGVERLKAYKEANTWLEYAACSVFWSTITDPKWKRKLVKRNVMTLPYGGTPYGLGQQQIDDAKKHGIDVLHAMEHKWGSYLGRLVYTTCKSVIKRPMQLLAIFEEAGVNAEKRGEFLSWTVPLTKFPVVQNYVKGVVKKLWVQYGPPIGPKLNTGYYENTLQLAVMFVEETEPAKNKQSQGASPNIIHSLDAAHLTAVVDKADFPISTVHDSFGALLPDVDTLRALVLTSFYELYALDPLKLLLEQLFEEPPQVEKGSYSLTSILSATYAFS